MHDRVYLVMTEADAHSDPVFAVFSTQRAAIEYAEDSNELAGVGVGDDPEYRLEVVPVPLEK